MSFSNLPIVDLKDDEETIIKSIFNAAITTGFFYLRNHDLYPQQLQMFQLAKQYFQLSIEEKEKNLINKQNNFGYLRRGHENLDSTLIKQMDEKEAFNLKKYLNKDQLPTLFQEENHFQLINSFHENCFQLAMKLLTYLAIGFQIDPNYFTSEHQWDIETGEILRLLHYPQIDCQSSTQINSINRAGAHSDYGSISFVFQHNQRSGLEVLDRSNQVWYPVQADDQIIVVNFGDAAEYWSKGLIKSIVHRVAMPQAISNEDNERFSIIYFAHPNLDSLLTPIPSKLISDRQFIKDAHAQHALNHQNEQILTAGEHLQMRLDQTHYYK